MLPEEVSSALEAKVAAMKTVARRECFGTETLTKADTASSVEVRTAFLAQLDSGLSTMASLYGQLWQLDRVLSKKKDPHTHAPFDDAVYSVLPFKSLARHAWDSMVDIMASAFKDMAESMSRVVTGHTTWDGWIVSQ